jgi:hypothetical protein
MPVPVRLSRRRRGGCGCRASACRPGVVAAGRGCGSASASESVTRNPPQRTPQPAAPPSQAARRPGGHGSLGACGDAASARDARTARQLGGPASLRLSPHTARPAAAAPGPRHPSRRSRRRPPGPLPGCPAREHRPAIIIPTPRPPAPHPPSPHARRDSGRGASLISS